MFPRVPTREDTRFPPLVRGHRTLDVPYLPEEEDQRCSREAEETKEPKVVHVSHKQRLLAEDVVKDLRRLTRRAPCALVSGESVLNYRESLLVNGIELREMSHEYGLVRPRSAGDEGGDPDTAAEVAHEIEEPAGIADLVLRERAHAGSGERDENKTDRDPTQNRRPDNAADANAQVDVPKEE